MGTGLHMHYDRVFFSVAVSSRQLRINPQLLSGTR